MIQTELTLLLCREENVPSGSANAGSRLPLAGQLQPDRAVAQHQQRQQRLHPGPGGGPGARQEAEEGQRHRTQPQPHRRSDPVCDGHQPAQPL